MLNKKKYQKQVYTEYSGFVYTICMRYSDNSTDADLILHEIFLGLFKQTRILKNSSDIKQYILNYTKRFIINRYTQFILFENHNNYTSDLLINDNDINFDGIDGKIIIETLQRIPQVFRVVLNMHMIDEYDYVEISAIFNIEINVIIEYYNIALQLFKKNIQLYEQQRLAQYA